MRHLHAALLAAAALLLAAAPARGFSTLSGVSASRSLSATRVKPGQTITVTLTLKVGAIGSAPLRGLYIAEPVPDALTPASGTVKVGGKTVTVTSESSPSGAVYTGCRTMRWVLEQPPSFAAAHPVAASSTVTVSYTATLSASAKPGTLSFPGLSWVGMIPSQGDAGDHFGYEGAATAITVESGPIPDGGVAGDSAPSQGDSGGAADNGAAPGEAGVNRADQLDGSCSLGGRGARPTSLLLLAGLLLALLWRRRARPPGAIRTPRP